MENRVQDVEREVRRLESKHQEILTKVSLIESSNEGRREHIDFRFKSMDKRFDKLDTAIGRLMWLIGAALVGGFMQFVISGGLAPVG